MIVGVINSVAFYRKQLNLSQTDLGCLSGVSRQTISNIECFKYIPSIYLALRLSRALNVKVDDLFYFDEKSFFVDDEVVDYVPLFRED